MPSLPPPDPHESFELTPLGGPLPAPTAIFLRPATPESDRVADRVLDLRPGMFIVVAGD